MPRERRDDEYRQAIVAIIASCGLSARAHLLSRHPLLTPAVVRSLARTTPERQAFELNEVRAGRRPFVTKTEVFDTTGYGEVGSRLARTGGYINKFARAVELLVAGELGREDRNVLDRSAADLLRHCGALWAEVRQAYKVRPAGCPDGTVGYHWQPPRDWSKLSAPSVRSTVGMLGAPAAFVEKCVRDLRRVPDLPRARRFWPTRAQTHSLGIKLFQMSRQLLRAREQLAGAYVATTVRVVTHTRPDADARSPRGWPSDTCSRAGGWKSCSCRQGTTGRRGRRPTASSMWAACAIRRSGCLITAPPARADRTETCATELVWEHQSESGRGVEALGPLVDAVRAGDSTRERGRSVAYAVSRREGVHALIAGLRARGARDREMWATVRNSLNVLHSCAATRTGNDAVAC